MQLEDRQLTIRGKRQEDEGKRVFLHQGIAARQFQRTFVLAEGIEIIGAALDNGLLNIDLERPVVAPKVRTIEIASGAPSGAGRTIEAGSGPAKAKSRRVAAEGDA